MATHKTTSNLQLTLQFSSGNNQILSIINPKDDLSANTINELSAFIATNQLILGDNSAQFIKICKAKYINKTTVKDTHTLTA